MIAFDPRTLNSTRTAEGSTSTGVCPRRHRWDLLRSSRPWWPGRHPPNGSIAFLLVTSGIRQPADQEAWRLFVY